MRYMAIDLGDKRTGIAAGDDETRLVCPWEVIGVRIAHRAGEGWGDPGGGGGEEPPGPPIRGGAGAEIVIGLPLNMDGSEGPKALQAREFGARIARRTGRVVRFQDERLTSVDADWAMARSGMTRKQKKGRRDALAAAAILRDFLGAAREGESRSGT